MIERRTFLQGLAATGAFAWLPGCGGTKKASGGLMGWDLIVAARDASRASPDHLSARAAEIVATKDFTRAVRFVRDNVRVAPPASSFDDAVSGVRWGADGALRAGLGTQRERADLLAAMLTAMGATAAVKPAMLPAEVDAKAIYGVKTPPFSADVAKIPGLTADQATQIKTGLATPLDPDSSELVASLAGMLPDGADVAMSPFDGVAAIVPVVEYTADGVTKWAFALGGVDEVTTAPAGLGGALSPAQFPTVSVRLLAALGDVPGVPTSPTLVELVAGTWKADQIAGTRLFVTTSSSDPTGTAGAPSDQITLRTTALRVQQSTAFTGDAALWTPKLAPVPASFAGRPFTTAGALFTPPASPGDPWSGPYGGIANLDDASHAAAVASVASLQVAASGGAYPDVQLSIAALDQAGAPVYGLTSKDFAVTDESKPQAPTLLGNAKPDPLKVMLAYDCSGSVTWPTPADRDAFDTALANALVGAAGARPYEVGVASIGSSPPSYAAPDATSIVGAFNGCVGFSDIWLTLGNVALHDGASAVIIVSDFQASDLAADIPALQTRFAASGLPVAMVPVGPMIDQTTMDAIKSLTTASVIDPTSATFQQQLGDFVSGVTAKAAAAPYRGGYHLQSAEQANQATRTVGVTLAGKISVSASATYTVPPTEMRGVAGIRGLYLEMKIGASTTVQRRLAGPALDRFGLPIAATPADYVATRQLLDGIVTVAFEPGAPTAGANVEDMFAGALSMKPVLDFGGKKAADVLPMGATIRPYSSSLAAMVSPLPTMGPIAVPRWMRVVILIESSSSDTFERRFDVVPELNLTAAASTDPRAAFASTLAATVPSSVREGLVLFDSSASRLAGAVLQYLGPRASPSTLTGFSADDLTAWSRVLDEYDSWHKIVPTSAAPGAMWIIDPATGTAIAVGVDEAGGGCGKAIANAAFQEALAVFQAYAAYLSLQCDLGMMEGFACDGALVGAVGASVAAIFAGILLDEASGLDIFAAAVAMFIGTISSAVGFPLSIYAIGLSTYESFKSIKEKC